MTKTWIERIDEAKARGGFTDEDFNDSASWVTCACGQQDAGIPRDADGVPEDSELRILGVMFFSSVRRHKFNDARLVLAQIQRRAIKVLAEVKKKNAKPTA